MRNIRFPIQVLVLVFVVTSCISDDLGDTPQGDQPEHTINFLRKRDASGSGMASELIGKLILVEGCLRIQSDVNPRGSTAIWPHEFGFSVQNNVISIIDGNDQVVARVGERIHVGGGGAPPRSATEWEEYVIGNPQQCAGPFWAVSSPVEVVTP